MFKQASEHNGYNFIDLFAGAGGLSEGFFQAGFNPIAHVEMDHSAAQTLETRSAFYYLKKQGNLNLYRNYLRGTISRDEFIAQIPEEVTRTIIQETMSDKTLPGIFRRIDDILRKDGVDHVDVIIGGPPCQAYSLVGRAQSSHMARPMAEDPRNRLYLLYARFLRKYKPKMFVFENVMGIETANGGVTWRNIRAQLKRVGYEIACHEQNASDFGVLQSRRRMIIVGWQKGTNFQYPQFDVTEPNAIVNDLLRDLPKLTPGRSGRRYGREPASEYVTHNHIREPEDILTLHTARPNIPRDIAIYCIAIQMWNNGHERLRYDELPPHLITHNNRNAFLDRFKVVEGDEQCCHTILAHLSKDGHYFIHPDIRQHRSITPREAARLQSFPDNYFFEGSRTAVFTQIGNAVPPMMARSIAEKIALQLDQEEKDGREPAAGAIWKVQED